MALGDAWQSPDAYMLLDASIDFEDGWGHAIVGKKEGDLTKNGKTHLLDGEPFQNELMGYYPAEDANLPAAYAALKKNGDEYRKHREEFMLAKLKKGQHPDTDPFFWAGYSPVAPVDLGRYDIYTKDKIVELVFKGGLALLALAIAIPVAWVQIKRFRTQKNLA